MNRRWGIVFTMLLPVAGTILWWGLIPVGSPTGGFSDKWVWVFILNPISCAFASYLLISLFLTALDEKRPWRPLKCYLPIMTAVYFAQACPCPLAKACSAATLPAALMMSTNRSIPNIAKTLPPTVVHVQCLFQQSQVS